jgi:hypothetical protein
MPGDFTIRLSAGAPPIEPAAPASTPDNAPDNTRNTPVGSALASVVPVNATLALDPEVGVVVIEFRNEVGTVVSSIPSAQQLTAYRDGVSSRAAPTSPGALASDAADAPGADLPPSQPKNH